jgi:hypothetical protein
MILPIQNQDKVRYEHFKYFSYKQDKIELIEKVSETKSELLEKINDTRAELLERISGTRLNSWRK